MGEIERIELLVSRERNAATFARKIGTTESSVSKLRSGAFKLTAFAERIALAYPELNCRWLLTGEGEPFGKEVSENEILESLKKISKDIKKLLK